MTALTEYKFICTRSTAPLNVPVYHTSAADRDRYVHNAFAAISGGFRRVGDIVSRPLSTAFEDHILCDGTVLNIADYQELFAYLGSSYGGDGLTTFAVPDALTGVTSATEAPPQTVTAGGTVEIGSPTPTPSPTPGEVGGVGTNVPSGGRPRNPNEVIP